MKELVLHQDSSKKLVEAGLLPPMTTSFALVCEVNRPVKLRTERWLTETEYRQFLAFMSEGEARPYSPSALAEDIVFSGDEITPIPSEKE